MRTTAAMTQNAVQKKEKKEEPSNEDFFGNRRRGPLVEFVERCCEAGATLEKRRRDIPRKINQWMCDRCEK